MTMDLRRCEWCGVAKPEMPVYPAETRRAVLMDPFEKKEPQFFACSDECRQMSTDYYSRYRQFVARWAGAFLGIFAIGFLSAWTADFGIFRWVMPGSIILAGLWLVRYPYYNNFQRTDDGSLKMSLQRSLRVGRIVGVVFVILGSLLCFANLFLPPGFE